MLILQSRLCKIGCFCTAWLRYYQILKTGICCTLILCAACVQVIRSGHKETAKKRRSERFIIWCWHCIQTGRKTLIFALCRSSVRCMVHLYIIGVICRFPALLWLFVRLSLVVVFTSICGGSATTRQRPDKYYLQNDSFLHPLL